MCERINSWQSATTAVEPGQVDHPVAADQGRHVQVTVAEAVAVAARLQADQVDQRVVAQVAHAPRVDQSLTGPRIAHLVIAEAQVRAVPIVVMIVTIVRAVVLRVQVVMTAHQAVIVMIVLVAVLRVAMIVMIVLVAVLRVVVVMTVLRVVMSVMIGLVAVLRVVMVMTVRQAVIVRQVAIAAMSEAVQMVSAAIIATLLGVQAITVVMIVAPANR